MIVLTTIFSSNILSSLINKEMTSIQSFRELKESGMTIIGNNRSFLYFSVKYNDKRLGGFIMDKFKFYNLWDVSLLNVS